MQRDANWLPEMGEVFGLVFMLERKLESLADRVLAPHNITAKQWFLIATVEAAFDKPPSLLELAQKLSTSHQNVKAIAQNLEARGFLRLYRDPEDRRVTRLMLLPESEQFWKAREPEHKGLLQDLFDSFQTDEVCALRDLLYKLIDRVASLHHRTTIKATHTARDTTREMA